MRHYSLTQPIDPISCAESVIALLEHLNFVKLPPEERMALVSVQIEAIEDLLATFPVPFAGDPGSFRFPEGHQAELAGSWTEHWSRPGPAPTVKAAAKRPARNVSRDETAGSGI